MWIKRIGWLWCILWVVTSAACANSDLSPEPSSPPVLATPTATLEPATQPATETATQPAISTLGAPRPTATSNPSPSPEITPSPLTLPLTLAATLPLPPLAPGKVKIKPQSSAEPPVFSYICPWLEFAGDLPVYSYRVVNSYPHDAQAYTQGLVFQDGVLYESTGNHSTSSVRIVDLESGTVEQIRQIPEQYFAEGLAYLEGRLYQLTWKEQTGFIYLPEDLSSLGEFRYSTEGWGLTDDEKNLIMSDGSDRLYWLSPLDLMVKSTIPVTNNGAPVVRLNELEFVEGELWANIFQTSCIARVDPASGKVTGWIDIGGLLSPEELVSAEVPNGIAYDSESGRIFVTGKYWPRLFEIEIFPLNH